MTESIGSLHGAKLLVSPLDEPWKMFGGRNYSSLGRIPLPEESVEQETIAAAEAAGATIVRTQMRDTSHMELLEEEDVYCFGGYSSYLNKKLADTAGTPDGPRMPRTVPLSQATEAESGNLPLVLASGANGGEGKYLLERPDQLAKVLGHHKKDMDPAGMLMTTYELREFIPTPGDHFTSYRVLTAPTGEILAGGLLYSGHVAAEGRKVGGRAPGSFLSTIGNDPFGDPYSDSFLAAADIRSNIQQGGTSIPLMGGDSARALTYQDKLILEQHGINPGNPEIPERLAAQATAIGRTAGKGAGLVAGLDFLQHRDTGDMYFLEANIHPGTQTYAECFHGGESQGNAEFLRKELFYKSLGSIARKMHL